jgi:hypothetical protein
MYARVVDIMVSKGSSMSPITMVPTMDVVAIIQRVTDDHRTNKDRCADCKKYRGQYFFIHYPMLDEWTKFLHDPTVANDLYFTEYDKKCTDDRKLIFEGQPPIKLTVVPLNIAPQFVLSYLDKHFGKNAKLSSIWTIKP